MFTLLRLLFVWVIVLITLGAGMLPAEAQLVNSDLKVFLTPGQTTAEINGTPVDLDVPAVIEEGYTLVPLRFVAEALQAVVQWNGENRSILLQSLDHHVFLQVGNPKATVNGASVKLALEPQIRQNRAMVPLRFVSQALEADVHFQPDTKLISITRSIRLPVADFTFVEKAIPPQGSPHVVERSSHPRGLAIVDREWTGLYDRYPEPGTYDITLRVKDEQGNWSLPVTRTLVVKHPPVAGFRTEKSSYRSGEPLVYINESYDPDGKPLTLKWEAQPAYFEPGNKSVRLTVTDLYGLTSTASATVEIIDDIYYTKEQFYLIYGKVGAVVPYEKKVLDFPVLTPQVTESNRTLLRVNSPEEIKEEGILYRDNVSGPVRVMVHHLNRSPWPIRIHALAHNPSSSPITVRITRQGLGGPSADILHLGRVHLTKFFSIQSEQVITVPAGKTVNLLSSLSAAQMAPNACLSGMWDLEVSAPLTFTFASLKAEDDPLEHVDRLPVLPADGMHIRGTFPVADRELLFDVLPAGERGRIVLADSQLDPPETGIDAMTGQPVQNLGNYGVVYTLVLSRLPDDTAILLNPRGGNFCGAVRIGQQVVQVPTSGYAPPHRHAVVLYRNEDGPHRITVDFSPPSGSYLPVNILLLPIPESKGEPGPLIPN
ncbi:MAG: stalk domain-containing protein [Clostridia bacterium]|nr:stalk domain-containing protein [Clostridia bacterium]